MPKPAKSQSTRTLSVQDCADELGLEVELLRDYAMRGCPHDKGGRGKSNVFDPDEVAAWMKANNLTGKTGRPSNDSPDMEAAKLREVNLRCTKHEIKIAQDMGQLIPTHEITRMGATTLGMARTLMLGGVATLSTRLDGREGPDRDTIIDEFFRNILTELARGLSQLGEGIPAPTEIHTV